MSKINITLNGKQLTVDSGQIILEVCREQGIFIPTLCHQPDLKPFASCWICIVEVKGAKGFVPACSTQVVDGMVIETDNNDILEARKLGLELLFSNHYADCFPPCTLNCPAEVDAQGYIALVANGQFTEAMDLVRVTNPFPVVCGLVCTAPCETACRRNIVDQPVSIRAIKRAACDYSIQPSAISHQPSTTNYQLLTNRVAIVGAGPAGLTCAYFLAKKGYLVTVFESMPEPGGMLRYGIPEYRLPKTELNRDIDYILSAGMELKTDHTLGKDFTLKSLTENGYKAIFIAVGAQLSQKLGIENEDLSGVYGGIDFLRATNSGKKIGIGKKVVVIGGGNTAIDSARSALRSGTDEVTIIYRRTRNEMPAHPAEIDEAEFEGVKIKYLAAPVKIVGENDKVKSIICQQMKLGEPDASGRRRPEPVPGSEFEINCDTIIAAIGQQADSSFLSSSFISKHNTIIVDKTTLQSTSAELFAGGDVVTGPGTAVEAIGMGRRAAIMIDQYLQLDHPIRHDNIYENLENRSEMFVKNSFNVTKGSWKDINPEEFKDEERVPRYKMPMLPLARRSHNQKQTELGYTQKVAHQESQRCLVCGCLDLYECQLRELGKRYQVNLSRYPGMISKHPIDDTHPFIRHEQNKCILCGRCVRTCAEIQGHNALNFFYRGLSVVIGPPPGQTLKETDCSSCGQCVSACPTGALTEKMYDNRMGPWVTKKIDSVCPNCSLGCELVLETVGNRIVRIVPPAEQYLCDKGKFGYDFVNNEKRIKHFQIKKNGKLVKTDIETVTREVAQQLKKIVEKYGPDSVAVTVSPRSTNEEISILKKFAVKTLKTKNFLSLGLQYSNPPKSAEYSLIDTAKTVLIINSNPETEHPVLQIKIRKAVSRGVEIMYLNNINVVAEEGHTAKNVGRGSCLERSRRISLANLSLEDTVVITNQDNFSVADWLKFEDLLTQKRIRDRTIVLNNFANTRGLQQIGTLVDRDSFLTKLKEGKIKAIYMFLPHPFPGENVGRGSCPERSRRISLALAQADVKKLEFSVIQTTSMNNKLFKLADIILPAASFAETEGTFTNSEGRIQKLSPAFPPFSEYTNIEILQKTIKAYKM